MTKEEYYDSSEFKIMRLLGHFAHDMKQKTQETFDILEILLEKRQDLLCCDKFNLVERQLRIVDIETVRLIDRVSNLSHLLSPKLD